MKLIMRNLYWKLFLFFWLAITLMIFSSAWFTSELAGEASADYRTQGVLKDSANAAAIIYQTGNMAALKAWLYYLKTQHGIDAFLTQQTDQNHLVFLGEPLFESQAERLSHQKAIRNKLGHIPLPLQKPLREGDVLVSSPIAEKNNIYRLILAKPPLAQPLFATNWKTLMVRLLFASFISGIICYILSRYLTKPLAMLQNAARKIGSGQLNIRVLPKIGNRRDEIYELASEFDLMTKQLERSIASQQRLLRYISHELRSPLARLRVALELLHKRLGTQIPATELNRIWLESDRLNELIHEILILARLDLPKQNQRFVLVNLTELLKEVISDVNFEIQNTPLHVSIHAQGLCQVMGNPHTLRSAFENLIRNAIKHGKTDVDVGISFISNLNNSGVRITIRDYGQGIDKKELPHLFEPFYRTDTTQKGYGLGLTIVKKTIKLHHGTIHITNHSKGGLFVNIFLPTPKQMK
jgi:two-component system sensor histidine kinase CpxA